MPTLLNARGNMEAFAPITYAHGRLGHPQPRQHPGRANTPRIGPRAGRPVARSGLGAGLAARSRAVPGGGNLETLRASWQRAIDDGADLVAARSRGTTTARAPSSRPRYTHGNAFLDVSAYYAEQFSTGKTPPITRDALYVTHRNQPYAATPTGGQESLMRPMSSTTATQPRDTVELQTFLTAPATLTLGRVVEHGVKAEAGVTVFTVPLAVGTVSASPPRSGRDRRAGDVAVPRWRRPRRPGPAVRRGIEPRLTLADAAVRPDRPRQKSSTVSWPGSSTRTMCRVLGAGALEPAAGDVGATPGRDAGEEASRLVVRQARQQQAARAEHGACGQGRAAEHDRVRADERPLTDRDRQGALRVDREVDGVGHERRGTARRSRSTPRRSPRRSSRCCGGW